MCTADFVILRALEQTIYLLRHAAALARLQTELALVQRESKVLQPICYFDSLCTKASSVCILARAAACLSESCVFTRKIRNPCSDIHSCAHHTVDVERRRTQLTELMQLHPSQLHAIASIHVYDLCQAHRAGVVSAEAT